MKNYDRKLFKNVLGTESNDDPSTKMEKNPRRQKNYRGKGGKKYRRDSWEGRDKFRGWN